VTTSICYLFAARCPSAIIRRVVAVVVDAINRKMRAWPTTHIRQKVCETLLPSLANFNSPSAVIGKCMIVRISASSLHCLPNEVFRMLIEAVLESPSRESFSMKTSAGFSPSSSEAAASNAFLSSAIANAFRMMSGLRNHKKSSEAKSNRVDHDGCSLT
jgi:hypothetical protein